MMRRHNWGWTRHILVIFVMAGVAPSPAWAGAWTLPRDRWYVEYFYRYFYSKHTFDRDGNRVRRAKAGRFTDIRNELKFEYGITDWWNLLGSVPYISAQFKDDTTNLLRTGVQDIFLRTKFRVLNTTFFSDRNPFVASTQFSLKFPAGYDFNENPLGDGQVDFESRLQLSQSWTYAPAPARVRPRSARLLDEQTAITAHDAVPPIASSRDEALRDAFLQAELMQRGEHFYAARNYAEAAEWFQAVLQEQPSNFALKRIVLNHAARAMAIASLDGPPQVIPAAWDRLEPIADGQWEQTPMRDVDRWDTAILDTKVAFVNLEGAYTLRRGDPPNEFPLFAEVGFTPLKRLMVIGSLDAVVSAKQTIHEESFGKWGLRGIFNVRGDGFASVFRTGGPTVNLEFGYNELFGGRNTADAYEVFTKLAVFF